jgi:Skp family chaperone for outer membrane proteins
MKLFWLIIFIFCSFNSLAENITVVDVNYLVNESNLGKKIQNDLQKKEIEISKNFREKEIKLKEKERIIISKKNILSAEEFNNEVNIFNSEFENYKKIKNEKLVNYEKYKNEKYSEFSQKLNKILANYSKQNDIDMILDKKNILIIKINNDITDEILKIINN